MAQQTFEEIVAAVKQAESRGKRYAADGKTLTTSPKGALGEMQVMPKTITDPGFGVAPAKDKSPDEIARVGRDYLQAMLGKYGDTEKALVAYNWGPGATDKWLASGAKPEALPQETRTYVQRVKGLLGKDVPRETMAKKEREPLPESLPPMAKADQSAPAATVAMASGKNLPDIKSMPASYQAAFALAALADAQDEEDDRVYNENKSTETEEFFANYKPVNKLASLDLSVTPVMMKDGGEASSFERLVPRRAERRLTPQQMESYVTEGSQSFEEPKAKNLMERFNQLISDNPALVRARPLSPLGVLLNAGYGTYQYVTGKDPLRDLDKAAYESLNPETDTGSETISEPISVGLPPLRRANGSPEEGEDLTKPSFGNPNIRKQGEAARRLAAMRDVNTLPDPKTYAAVAGALGTRPDQMGFSVLHPKYQEIRDVANPAFAAGTALQMAPAVQALGGGKAAKMLGNMAGQEFNAALMGERPGTLLDMFTAPAQPKFMFVRARPEAAARHADLQAQGLSPEQIRAQNLTLVDNRGNLLEEISDAPAVLQQKTASVPRNFYEMLKHPELESIYPTYDMPQVMMETTKRKGAPLAMGNFDVQNNMISGRIRDLPEDDARSMVRGTVLHEGQHAIQSAEGFTEGANPGAFIAYVKARQGKYNPDPTVNANVIREMERAYPNLASVADNFTTRLQADKYMKYVVSDPDRYVGETLYRHMPGEVQAELVRVRSNLSPEQLKATPLEVSMQQLGVDPKNILEMNKMGSRPDRYVGDVEYDGYAHGGIVHRADGSPEEGERLTPQQIERIAAQEAAAREQASTAAFITSKSGIGRKAGNISNALNTGTAYPAIVAGINDVPYDLAGLPVDLTTMAMRPFGYSNQKPMLGSEYLKEKATEAGIRKPMTEDPTLKGFHYLGEFGAGMMAPGKIIEGAQALKVAAKDALAGFKAGRAEKPGMTDLMTGQRVEAPTRTAAQEEAEQRAINAVFDNMAGVNQRQIAADVAAGRLPQSLAPRPALLEAEQNIARLPADAQTQLRLFEEAAARPRPFAIRRQNPTPEVVAEPPAVAETRPAAQLPVAAPVAPPVAVPVSAEFPFVGRLDEFAASMKGPAQKEQLINQVKSKFREQDVARLEAALVGLGPKDKVTPAVLQEALANTYSPNRFRSAEIPSTGSMYDSSDNVFFPDKKITGAMNLYLRESPELLSNMDEIAKVKQELTNVLYGFPNPEKIKNINEFLAKSPLAVRVAEFGMLQQRLQDALPTVTRFGKISDELDEARALISFPLSYNKDGFNYWRELDRRAAVATEGMPNGLAKRVVENNFRVTEEPKLVQELMQKGSDKLVALGGQPIDVTGYMTRNGFLEPIPMGPGGVMQPRTQSVANRAFDDDVLQKELKDISTPIEKGVKSALEKIQQSLRPDFRKLEEALQPFTGYGGRHRQATNSENMPIGFSRFTEHTVDMNGQQLKGRHVHELQSDLSKDMKVLGPKGGSVEKDQKELDNLLDKQTKLMQESSDLTTRFVAMPDTDPLLQKTKSNLSALDAEIKKIDQRKKLLKARITPPRAGDPVIGKYFLEEPFANFETNSPVRMQLLIKNAIQSSIRAGQDFVTFPGKESAKPALYEKLLPNLKQAVKDLGGEKAGFEIKPITLPNPNGDSPTVWGVVWSPATAAKAIEKGVPFNKGGMVERQPTDNRRYL